MSFLPYLALQVVCLQAKMATNGATNNFIGSPWHPFYFPFVNDGLLPERKEKLKQRIKTLKDIKNTA
jgi:hypothetical protein